MVGCCVPLCKSQTGKPPDVTFFQIPKGNPPLRNVWLAIIAAEAKKRGKQWSPAYYARVCSLHFTASSFSVSTPQRKRLLPDAYPSIFGDYSVHPKNPPKRWFGRNQQSNDEDYDVLPDEEAVPLEYYENPSPGEPLEFSDIHSDQDSRSSISEYEMEEELSTDTLPNVLKNFLADLKQGGRPEKMFIQRPDHRIILVDEEEPHVDRTPTTNSTLIHRGVQVSMFPTDLQSEPSIVHQGVQVAMIPRGGPPTAAQKRARKCQNDNYRLRKQVARLKSTFKVHKKINSQLSRQILRLKATVKLLKRKTKKRKFKSRLQKQFDKVHEEADSSFQASFLLEQIKTYGRKKAKFQEQTLKFCALLRKCSPKAYNYIRKSRCFIVPHPLTLKAMAKNENSDTVSQPSKPNPPRKRIRKVPKVAGENTCLLEIPENHTILQSNIVLEEVPLSPLSQVLLIAWENNEQEAI